MADTKNLATNRYEAGEENLDTAGDDTSLALSEEYARDLAKLQEELSALRGTVSTLLGEVKTGATRTIRAAGEMVTHQSSALAATASDRAHTFASELESLARRKPLSTIAGALLAGVVIGLLGRRRRSKVTRDR
jgi:ElaB/YqjD/DUF883 family membrane-anchored ribosome-binding protein